MFDFDIILPQNLPQTKTEGLKSWFIADLQLTHEEPKVTDKKLSVIFLFVRFYFYFL